MSLYQKYELLKLLDSGEVQSFQAREIATGRMVYVHWLSVEGERRAELLSRLRSLTPGKILELDDSLTPYVVTEVFEPFQGLANWLGVTAAAAPVPLAPVPALPTSAPPSALSEFSRIFGPAPTPEPPKPVPVAAPLMESPPALPPKPQPAAREPGEFTRMFYSPQNAIPAEPVLPNPPAPTPAGGPGEFTRLFMSPAAPSAPASPPPPEPAASTPKSEPGDFTRFFQSPVASNPIPIEQIERGDIAPPPPPPREAPFQGPGDFTQLFGVPEAAASNAPRAPLPQAHPFGGGEASALFRTPQPVSVAATPSASAEPSDFTRMVQAPKPAAAPSAGTMTAAPRRGLPMPVIILLCVLIAGCLLLAAYFLLRK